MAPQKWHHLKPNEFQVILHVVKDLRWRAFYLLAYTTGARFGELFNLTWADIDVERCTVTIQDRPGTAETPPFQVKDCEARALLLPNQTVEALLAWQPEAPEGVPLLTASRWRTVRERWQLCRAGKPWQRIAKTGELVRGEWENPYMPNNVIRDMRRHVRRARLELTAPVTIHTLRKSFAQNHAESGTPSMTLKALMGHASITTTEKFYLQQSDDNQRAALRRYETLLAGETRVKLAYEPSEGPERPTSPDHANPQTPVARPLG